LLARRLGFKPVLKSMQLPQGGLAVDWLASEKKYRRYLETPEGKLAIKSKFRNRCFRLWYNPVVLYTGEVVPCCFDKQGDYIMGDLNSSTFREIWKGEKLRAFRRQLLTSRRSIPICMNCTTGLNGVSGV
jgi:radical SAM protein with 4Fe4S-binding SPASM domain